METTDKRTVSKDEVMSILAGAKKYYLQRKIYESDLPKIRIGKVDHYYLGDLTSLIGADNVKFIIDEPFRRAEKELVNTVLFADYESAKGLAKELSAHSVFKISIEKNLVTVSAPLKDDTGNWYRNEQGKIRRFLILEYKNVDGKKTMRYNPKLINIEKS